MMNRFGDIDSSFKRLQPIYGYRSEKLVPIEKALEPIEPQIDELPYYIKIAKRNCHYPSEHELTPDQAAAVYIYTMEWGDTTLYRVLNRALRSENRQEVKVWFPYLKGVSLDIGKNFTKNQIVTWWSVNSCSSSVNVIKGFLDNKKNSTLFMIEAVNGKKVSGYTEFETEDEVILRMGSKFRVKSDPLEQSNGSYLVHLIEIDDDLDQPLASAMNNMELAAAAATQPSIKTTSIIPNIPIDARWSQKGKSIAGYNKRGNATNQLNRPHGLFVDDDQTMIIADFGNHRIVQWKMGDTNGQVVAGGKGEGNQLDQLKYPTDVLIDKETDSLIICDRENRRVVQWSRCSGTSQGEILIDNIRCWGLFMDDQRYLYVSDIEKHAVRRYQIGDKNGIIVAGGNGKGADLNQLKEPTYIFVDQHQTVYVADNNNHRVMRWNKGAKEGVVVAGGQGQGHALTQLSCPYGLFVDTLSTIYVADSLNHRVIRWPKGARQGTAIVGENSQGAGANHLRSPLGLSFDRQGNLYVVDGGYDGYDRIQFFSIQ
ncbi:unnamed protein product [Rotaria sp. Silwood1]|nr:unnamed protein product [Rotaria sp. Silwood1]CAF4820071.1 unnamed protein product [Rotaria sp. Silwood1]